MVSLRLGEPADDRAGSARLDRYPTLRFKLDPTSDWSDELIAELVETGAVDSVDFKGFYKGTRRSTSRRTRISTGRVIEAFPEAWIEDPAITDETRPVLAGHEDRITWDAPIHSIDDIEALPFPPRMVNVKPSRFGALRALLDCYDYLDERGIGAYGGGQFELGPGRGQIQYLASMFHPDTPNDVAPIGYNLEDPPPGPAREPAAAGASADGLSLGRELRAVAPQHLVD